jgi:hypothetical protein
MEVDSEESPEHNPQHLHPDHWRMMEYGPETFPYLCGAWKLGETPPGDQMEPRCRRRVGVVHCIAELRIPYKEQDWYKVRNKLHGEAIHLCMAPDECVKKVRRM